MLRCCGWSTLPHGRERTCGGGRPTTSCAARRRSFLCGCLRRVVVVSRPVGGVLSTPEGAVWPSISAAYLGTVRSLGRTSSPCPTLGLAPGGVCRADRVTSVAGALLPHRFTLTCAGCPAIGGLFSVALSCESPRHTFREHPALRSPDLPRRRASPAPRPPSRLTTTHSLTPHCPPCLRREMSARSIA